MSWGLKEFCGPKMTLSYRLDAISQGPITLDFQGPTRVGNGIHSEKIPRNRLGKDSVIPRKKVIIPRHSDVYGRVNSEARSGTE